MNRGYIFCHGQKHRPIEKFYLSQNVRWLTIDTQEKNDPDIIADIFTMQGLSNIGKADMVLSYHCPVGGSPTGFSLLLKTRNFEIAKEHASKPVNINIYDIVKAASFLLRKGGIFYFKSMIYFIVHIYTKSLILTDNIKFVSDPNEPTKEFVELTMGSEILSFETEGRIINKIERLYRKNAHVTEFINNYAYIFANHGNFSHVNTYEDNDGPQFCFTK